MDDNARPHRAFLVDGFLESEDIRRMDWPARSPDLNPIEYVWDALGRAIATHNPPSKNHPGNENSVAERVGPIATGNDKLPYFKYGVMLQSPYIWMFTLPLHFLRFSYTSDVLKICKSTFTIHFQHYMSYFE
ncbi:hypothetical protein AVEN_218484-1 [Araneus ventricosus]|uniref:Tc1-like transposase DDE domain-containing protein n=1 Tax=Araneus ventricosus TaxID=182803 RepID=A0A4Y2RLD6_ARAVE|nr:hypothetical protein AVEN_218484-1 [Araneus ventricosus]